MRLKHVEFQQDDCETSQGSGQLSTLSGRVIMAYCNKMIIIFLLYYERLGRGSAEFFDDCIKKARMY